MQKAKVQPHASGEKHPKQDFQVERIAFLSDAVFAIAITLLIIEFKVPHIGPDSTAETVWHELLGLKTHLVALLLSFLLIASYWRQHHFLFKHLHDYNTRIIIINFVVMLPIIFFPFTTALAAESNDNEGVIMLTMRLFLLNNVLAGLTLFYFYWMLVSGYKHLAYPITREERFEFVFESVFKAILFLLMLFVTLFTTDIKVILYVTLIPLFARSMYMRFWKNKKRS